MQDKTIKEVDAGTKKVIGKWEYLLNYWTPVVFALGALIAGIFWYANAEARMFTDARMKVEAETHIQNDIDNDEKYVRKEEFEKFLEIQKENREDIKEILKYLRK